MQKNKKINGYIINLDESLDRFNTIKKNLKDLGLKDSYQRFSAIQAKEGKGKVTNKVLGCNLSHLNIIKNAPSDKLIHIVEDDVYFPKSFPKNLEIILSQKTYLDWDIIFLSMGIYSDITMIKKFIDLKKSSNTKRDKITYIDGKYYIYGTHSYIVNPLKKEKILSMLIENNETDTLPIDTFYKNKVDEKKLIAFITFPFLTGMNPQFKTTIDNRPTHNDNYIEMLNKLVNVFMKNEESFEEQEEEQIIIKDIERLNEIFHSYLIN